MAEDDHEEKGLVDVEELFRKKALADTSLADLAIQSLEPYLDQLENRGRVFSMGNAVTKGGKFKGSVRSMGNFSSKGVTVVDNLSTMGNASVGDLIVVKNSTLMAGNSTVKVNAIFAGKTTIAGNSKFTENIISSTSLRIDGNITIKKQVITDGSLHLGGKVRIQQIQTLDSIFVRGKIFIEGMVKAKKFLLTKGAGSIGNDLIAREVGIGRDRHLKRHLRNFEYHLNLANPVNLAKFTGGVLANALFDRRKHEDPFEVQGDVIAHDIFLENVVIHGDLNAKRVTIGDNVEIKGRIEYSESLEVLTDASYESVQIGAEELNYLGPGYDEEDISGQLDEK
ncbi:MAG: hypothetical protein ACXAE3_08020 [Candidatus Kariarchaeaceae archaeon]|jgi:predicted acyltransferase (DUF342 family)